MTSHIIHGDARQTGLPDAYFHCVATSPPYFGLREYGDDEREIGDEPTTDEYIDEMRKVGREVWRVLRDDGTWWLNLGDSFASTTKGSGGSSTKSSLHGTGNAEHSGRFAKPVNRGIPSKNLLMIPQRVALALQADGWIVRAHVPWVKASCMPESVRDRPTVAHEYVFLLAKSQRYFWDVDAVRIEAIKGAAGSRFDVGKTSVGGTKGQRSKPYEDNPSGRNLRTSDFFNAGLDEYERHLAHVRENGDLLLSPDGNPLAFMVNPVGNKLAHFAMWPPRLVAPMIKASTSEKGCCPKCGAQWQRITKRDAEFPKVDPSEIDRFGTGNHGVHRKVGQKYQDWLDAHPKKTIGFSPSCECNAGDPIPCRVLDPFAGSGTTMQVCEALGRDSWGVELMAKNIPIIETRLSEKLNPETMKAQRSARRKPKAQQLEIAS